MDDIPPEVELVHAYFAELDEALGAAGDAKLDALEPLFQERAPLVADALVDSIFSPLETSEAAARAPQLVRRSERARLIVRELLAAALRGNAMPQHPKELEDDEALQEAHRDLGTLIKQPESLRAIVIGLAKRSLRRSRALGIRYAFGLVDSYADGSRHPALHEVAKTIIASSQLEVSVDKDGAAKDLVHRAWKEELPRLRGLLGTTAPRLESEALRADRTGSMLWLDAIFIEFIASTGARGKAIASHLKELSVQRWSSQDDSLLILWIDHEKPERARWVGQLVDALWHDKVHPEIQSRSHRPPAVVRAVCADRFVPMMTKQATIPALDDGTVRDDRGRVLGRIALTTDATLEAVRGGMHKLGSVAGNRLIRALIHRSHEAWNRGEQNPSRVAFEGGWQGLLDAIGVSHKLQQDLKDIAKAGQCIEWHTPHVAFGGLWLWSERRGTKAARAEVAFVLGDALTPGYGEELSRAGSKSLHARIARRLVPELRYEPPMGGARERDQGHIWTLHRLALLELVDHAEELARDGFVVIPPVRWRELAAKANVPTSILDRTLEAWVAGESDRAPALMERNEQGWTLAAPHEPERDFIAKGGKERTAGRHRKTKRLGKRAAKVTSSP